MFSISNIFAQFAIIIECVPKYENKCQAAEHEVKKLQARLDAAEATAQEAKASAVAEAKFCASF